MSTALGRYASPAAVLVLAITVAGCGVTDDGESEEEAGALAAGRAYVEAIAAGDVERADAMTDPTVFETASGPDSDTDVRAALPEATEPITDAWVDLLGPTGEVAYGLQQYVVGVSYTIGDLTGGNTITLTLDDDADPADVDSWTVTDALIGRGTTFADPDVVSEAELGGVPLGYSSEYRGVWGYPGAYLLEASETTTDGAPDDVEPLTVVVGAADAPPWDDSLPMLGEPGPDEDR